MPFKTQSKLIFILNRYHIVQENFKTRSEKPSLLQIHFFSCSWPRKAFFLFFFHFNLLRNTKEAWTKCLHVKCNFFCEIGSPSFSSWIRLKASCSLIMICIRTLVKFFGPGRPGGKFSLPMQPECKCFFPLLTWEATWEGGWHKMFWFVSVRRPRPLNDIRFRLLAIERGNCSFGVQSYI